MSGECCCHALLLAYLLQIIHRHARIRELLLQRALRHLQVECAHQIRVRLSQQLKLRVEHCANVAIGESNHVRHTQVARVEHAALTE